MTYLKLRRSVNSSKLSAAGATSSPAPSKVAVAAVSRSARSAAL